MSANCAGCGSPARWTVKLYGLSKFVAVPVCYECTQMAGATEGVALESLQNTETQQVFVAGETVTELANLVPFSFQE
jgi:hypothetical protein